MSDVTGPTSTLPGHRSGVEDGDMCDKHPDVPAVVRIQGETDSFGAEYYDVCQACLNEIKEYKNEGRCDWCKTEVTERRARRDSDEGLCGPVYYVCVPCIRKDNDRIQKEYNEWQKDEGRFEY